MKRILFLTLAIFLLLVGTGWGATPYYLNTTTGGGYVDPTGTTWGAGNDANAGTSKALPKASLAAAFALVTVNGDSLTVAPGTYTHSGTEIAITAADRTGIVIQGVDPANYPIIDGSALNSANAAMFALRGQTTLQYLDFRNVNKTAGYATGCYAVYNNIDGANITLQNCRFFRNYYDYRVRGKGTTTIKSCKFIEPYATSISGHAAFITAAAILNVYSSKFLGFYPDRGANAIPISVISTSTDTAATINIYNNEFAGYGPYAVYVPNSYAGTINIKNNAYSGGGYANYFQDLDGTRAIRTVSNNAYVSGGWPTATPANINQLNINCTDPAPLTDQLYLNGSRGRGYIIWRRHRGYDFAPGNDLAWSKVLAQKLYAKGWHLSVTPVYGDISVNPTMIADLQYLQQNYGAYVANAGYSGYFLNDTNTTPFTIASTGTWEVKVERSGSVPSETVTATVVKDSPAVSATINLVSGAIVGDTTANDLKTLTGFRQYLVDKGFTCGAINTSTFCPYPAYFFSRCLDTFDLTSNGSASINVAATHYFEMAYPVLNAATLYPGITFTGTTMDFGTATPSAQTITDAQSYSFNCGLSGEAVYSDAKIGQQLEKLGVFHLSYFSVPNLAALNDTQLLNWIRQVCYNLENTNRVAVFVVHGGTGQDVTAAQLDIMINEIAKHNVQCVTARELMDIILGDANWTTADSGLTYTRSSWPKDDYFRAPQPNSPLFGTGVDVGLTLDFAGMKIPNPQGTFSIGAYEWIGGVGGLSLSPAGGNFNPARRRQ